MTTYCLLGSLLATFTLNTQIIMRKKIYTITKRNENPVLGFLIRKTTILVVLFYSIIGSLHAQHAEHDHDTIKVLPSNDFSVAIISSNQSQLQFELVYKQSDTITPLFLELSVVGFLFTDECILQQSINNINVFSNIEKIWGPSFVSLGIGVMPPNGRYVTNLAILNGLATGSYIKVRVFGSQNGQDILWSGIVKY